MNIEFSEHQLHEVDACLLYRARQVTEQIKSLVDFPAAAAPWQREFDTIWAIHQNVYTVLSNLPAATYQGEELPFL